MPGQSDVGKAWGVADGERVLCLEEPRWLGAAAFSHDATRVVGWTLTGSLSLSAVP